MKVPSRILPVIVFAQFCCTSLWFAGNAVMSDLVLDFNLQSEALGDLTSAVQFGFILGTLSFAFLTISDRFSPSKVFFICAFFGAFFNLGIILKDNSLYSLLAFRFLTGFSLAGIYPVGMKIASDYFEKGLGKSLGFLVGALVVGTAFPHLLKDITENVQIAWKSVILFTSLLAVLGGVLIFVFIPDGPHRFRRNKPDLSTAYKVFKNIKFRAAAFGYFGHMWELYAFWAFTPVILSFYKSLHPEAEYSVPLISFLVIGLGGLACVAGGYISQNLGTKRTAIIALSLSGLCCLISPLIIFLDSENLLIGFLMFWGLVVVADSPLFSTLVAQNAPAESRGTALTIVNSIGFAITIVSIQLLNIFAGEISHEYLYVLLGIGPALGLFGFFRNKKNESKN
ncbi:MFS transporter [Christiangramia sp.]|uniref:MFS transporter n=1 Tax=Christiangramia sp. TaxID=1931228 RepID=UPI0026261960|nr:MFS transporter [Christiangramia sp.]